MHLFLPLDDITSSALLKAEKEIANLVMRVIYAPSPEILIFNWKSGSSTFKFLLDDL